MKYKHRRILAGKVVNFHRWNYERCLLLSCWYVEGNGKELKDCREAEEDVSKTEENIFSLLT